jgi:hypothetical protein
MSVLGFLRAAQSGLTLREVVANIPHDTPAFVVYAMLLVFVFMIWRANRPRRRM